MSALNLFVFRIEEATPTQRRCIKQWARDVERRAGQAVIKEQLEDMEEEWREQREWEREELALNSASTWSWFMNFIHREEHEWEDDEFFHNAEPEPYYIYQDYEDFYV